MTQLAPGARALIRDEEWLIRRVDPSADGGWLLTCDGISELVRGQSALYLTALEDDIEILDPAQTLLVPDDSPKYNATMLYLESQRRRTVPNDTRIHLGHRGVMNVVPYQLDPALQALQQPRARILIADSVGLGKTLEAGILATELIQRGRGKRILVVTQKAMLTQFQKEWWSRFSIPLVRLDSMGLARVRNRIPANHNPFNHFDRSIISIDTLKSNLEYRNYLENAWWDMIVIDECHNVAARAGEMGLGLDQWLLLDRYKWPQNRALRFDWAEILDRKDPATLQAAAALLHQSSLAPGQGNSLLESLDENAHKHAFGVSEDLKHALREAIELLGNEAANQLRQQASDSKKGFFSGKDQLDPADLSLECLRMVYDVNEAGHRQLRKHPRGSFVYRLAGRDRQKSASYYTPQVLTQCLVKYALKELLGSDRVQCADDILTLTVCEPAMGSAAFLNEGVNQLAEAYLERKQAELKTRIPHDA